MVVYTNCALGCGSSSRILSTEHHMVLIGFHFPNIQQEQQINCTGKLQQTTGLIQFCIETLKETDNAAFLQVSKTIWSLPKSHRIFACGIFEIFAHKFFTRPEIAN